MNYKNMTIKPTTTARQFGLPKLVLSLRQTPSFLTANSHFAYGGLLRSLLITLLFLLTGVTGVWATDYYFLIVNKSGKIVTYAKYSTYSSTTVNASRIPAAIKSVNATNWRFYNGDKLNFTGTITFPTSNQVVNCSAWGNVSLKDNPTQMRTFGDCESSTAYPNYIFVFSDYLEGSTPDLKNGVYYTMQYRGDSQSTYAYYDASDMKVANTGNTTITETDAQNDTKYLWYFKGNIVGTEIDPYDIKIYNGLRGTGTSDHFVASPPLGQGPEHVQGVLKPESEISSATIKSYYVATSSFDVQYIITGNPAKNGSYIYYNLWAEYQQNGQTPANYGKSGITNNAKFMRTGERNMYSSIILTQATKKYIIVDAAGNTIAQALTQSNTLDVPDVIKSPFASYTYYSTQADAIAGTNPINSVTSPTIYVRYTTQSGDMDFNGGTNYFICTNGNYLYASNSTTLGIESSLSDPYSITRKWKIIGNDAYQLTLQNSDNSQYVTYDVSSGEAVPTLSETGSKFFLHQSNTGQYELVAITSGYYSTNYYSMGVANNTLKLYSSSNYAMGDNEVQSVIYSLLICATPDISFDNTTNQIAITCATEGATIHYTTNGDQPTESSPSTPNPFTINSPTTVKAIATNAGYLTSTVADLTIAQVSTPTISYNTTTNKVEITSDTGATIYYTTDGTDPTTASTQYTEPFAINETSTIKAFAVKENCINSAVATETFNKVTTPTITFNRTTNKATISTTTTGATIYYTTDGTEPSTSSSTYSEAIPITTPTTIKAIAIKSSLINSEVSTLSIEKAATPTVSLDYTTGAITITSATEGADIYYTTNGTDDPDPDSNPVVGTKYVGPFVPTTAVTIKAIAIKENTHIDSDISESVSYSKVETPVITVLPDGSAVTITCSTQNAIIHYTTDGSTPTNSSPIYYQPISDNISGNTIKAIAVRTGMIISDVATSSGTTLKCATPVITRETGNKFSISCSFPTEGVTIYYTTDGNDPTTSSAVYSEPVSFVTLPTTVKAIAVATNYENSIVASKTFTNDVSGGGTAADPFLIESSGDFELFVTKVNNGTGASAYYKVTNNFSAAGCSAVSVNFTGTFDGGLYTISDLSNPLFTSASDAIIKNVILDKVGIRSQAGNVGAIVCEAKGYTRIYNCGILPNDATFPEGTHPSVEATGTDGCAGSIVGKLEDDSRVVNCFSYADVKSSGTAAGIVGYNTFASDASATDGKYTKLRTMVVNCMYYGNITASTPTYPVYGGQKISNTGATAINNYNFYSVGCQFSPSLADYNCSWPAQLDYLTRYEFHRNLLNSNRELCGWWVGAPSAPSGMTTSNVQKVPKDASLIAKWVLDPAVAPYPILKPFGKYSSPINIDADAAWRHSANPWEGKNLGTLNVTVSAGAHHSGTEYMTLTITDMDTLRTDYCYRKVQLPYYNTVFGNPNGSSWSEKYANNYGDYVVIGWKVSTTEGTTGTLTEDWQTGYNFADRNCTAKDADRIFAQGGYYYVPEGVENITITAQWAEAVYLDNSSNSYDRVFMSNSRSGTHFAPAGKRSSTLGNGKTVLTVSLKELATNADYSSYIGDVSEHAVVLVGNHQYRHGSEDIGTATGGFTVMSSDFDFDEEPDHCLIWQLGNNFDRKSFCPIRFDFLPVEEIGLAMKEDGSTQYYSLGCFRPLGYFEVTETSLIHFIQFEFSNRDRTIYAPLILNGGIYDQYTKGHQKYAFTTADDKIDYVIVGGNARIPSFTPGAHANKDAKYPTRHCAVNVIGGNIDYLYLTGNYNDNVIPNTDNPHCYIDGGRIKQVAAAGKEGINGDVYFKINHSKIWEFYGGSTMDQSTGNNFKIVKGNIDVTIDNSIVDKYCGGPKFGDMVYDENNSANSKTVTTNANNTIFGVYYGGGNGGTSYVQYFNTDATTTVATYDWNLTENDNQGHLNDYIPGSYRSDGHNYIANYEMEIVNVSTGTRAGEAVFRTYFYAAQFSATNTGPITNNLTNCTVLNNYYGGGFLGGVKGSVTSTLTGTQVLGSAYGAGFSATIPDVTIYNKDKTAPTIDIYTGIITPTPDPDPASTSTTYTWCYKNPSTNEVVPSGVEIPNDVNTSNPRFRYENKDYFYTEVPLVNLGTVSGDVTLTIDGTSTVAGNVFGGGESSTVGGNVIVNIKNGTVSNDVYGGGALANTNTDGVAKTTTVNLTGGTINGNVYGGAMGDEETEAKVGTVLVKLNGTPTQETVQGQTVTVYNDQCVVKGSIFGCNNVNGTPLGNVEVHIYKTWGAAKTAQEDLESIDDTKHKYHLSAVYGGGNLAAYEPTDQTNSKAHVIIDGCDLTSIRQVYGGGNAACVPATQVDVHGTYEIEELFGGGNGKDQILVNGVLTDNPGANVGYRDYSAYEDSNDPNTGAATKELREANYTYGTGQASVNVYGGLIHRVYGGSNTKGNVRVVAVTMLEEVGDCEFNVDEAYGGGKSAPMDGEAKLIMSCIPGLKVAYGGAENAEIHNNVTLNITNGTFDRVFGGNNISGIIDGTITVNVQETGCRPVIIGQLYGGGNQAPYSAPFVTGSTTVRQPGPTINVNSFTSIGEIYGGGYGATAIVTGDTHVNINAYEGRYASTAYAEKEETISFSEFRRTAEGGFAIDGEGNRIIDTKSVTVTLPGHEANKMGAIYNVYGGGNAARVIGNAHVNIGTAMGQDVYEVVSVATGTSLAGLGYYTRTGEGTTSDPYEYEDATGTSNAATTYYQKKAVLGADIRGNVYGGGNEAIVTGSTNVIIGTE